jgi:hypothetical protein
MITVALALLLSSSWLAAPPRMSKGPGISQQPIEDGGREDLVVEKVLWTKGAWEGLGSVPITRLLE